MIYQVVNSIYYGSMSFALVVISQDFFISLLFCFLKETSVIILQLAIDDALGLNQFFYSET